MSVSQRLREILGNQPSSAEGTAYIEKISEDPLLAVGFVVGHDLDLLLVLPAGVLAKDIKTNRLAARKDGTLNIQANFEKETIQADYILFDELSPAVAIVLDALESAILGSNDVLVSELLHDFLEMFRPGGSITTDEIVGLWGELITIAHWTFRDDLVAAWHEDPAGRYDFAKGGQRLEVKTSLGSLRKHSFSSSQLPPAESLEMVVVSVLAEHVPGATSILDLWADIDFALEENFTKKKLREQVLNLAKRDEEKLTEFTFDRDMSEKSIRFFPASAIPTVLLPHGVLAAKWEAIIDENLSFTLLKPVSGPEQLFNTTQDS